MRALVVRLDDLLADDGLDMNRAEGEVIDDLGLQERLAVITIMTVVRANCCKMQGSPVIEVEIVDASTDTAISETEKAPEPFIGKPGLCVYLGLRRGLNNELYAAN